MNRDKNEIILASSTDDVKTLKYYYNNKKYIFDLYFSAIVLYSYRRCNINNLSFLSSINNDKFIDELSSPYTQKEIFNHRKTKIEDIINLVYFFKDYKSIKFKFSNIDDFESIIEYVLYKYFNMNNIIKFYKVYIEFSEFINLADFFNKFTMDNREDFKQTLKLDIRNDKIMKIIDDI